MTELISKNLQRYFDNKHKYNVRAKEYFNNIYYKQNREAILEKGRLYRAKQRLQNVKRPKKEKVKQIYISNNNTLTVCFD
jgi:hypothetical protein